MKILIFTDLDGTLLDHDTYRWEEAKPALNLCKRHDVPVIMVSSKTRAELETLRKEIGLSSPFISENGGGIFFPKEGISKAPSGTLLAENLWMWSLGSPYDFLVTCLREIGRELGWKIRGFSQMTVDEISQCTGLDLERSRLAAMREFDEPFMVLEQEKVDITVLQMAAEKRGLKATLGGRFFHLHGKNDKGAAVKKIISWYKELHQHQEVFTVALGDSPNDLSMLGQVDHPVLIGSLHPFPGVEETMPNLRIAHEAGPKGWNSAILDILGEKK